MMSIFCYTCKRSFEVTDKEIIYDNGSNMAVYKCPTCDIRYLLADDEKTDIPLMFKLTSTKSHVVSKEVSRVIKLEDVRSNILIPGRR